MAEALFGGVDAVDQPDDRRVGRVGAEVDQESRFKDVEADDQDGGAVDHAQDFFEVDAVVVAHCWFQFPLHAGTCSLLVAATKRVPA